MKSIFREFDRESNGKVTYEDFLDIFEHFVCNMSYGYFHLGRCLASLGLPPLGVIDLL